MLMKHLMRIDALPVTMTIIISNYDSKRILLDTILGIGIHINKSSIDYRVSFCWFGFGGLKFGPKSKKK
jgi:hypothetical protein